MVELYQILHKSEFLSSWMELFLSILWLLDLAHGSKLIGELDLKLNKALIHRSVLTLPVADRRLCESYKPQPVWPVLSDSLPVMSAVELPLGGAVYIAYLHPVKHSSHTLFTVERHCWAWQCVSE